MWVLHFFTAVFAGYETWNQIHRAWSIQRVQSNQVFESGWTRITQHPLHASAFKLEYGFCFSILEQTVGGYIIQWNIFKGEIFLALVALLYELARDF